MFSRAEILGWYHRVRSVNRRYLADPPVGQFRAGTEIFLSPSKYLKAKAIRLIKRRGPKFRHFWFVALNALGAEWAHRTTHDPEDAAALKRMFDLNVDLNGNWLSPIDEANYAMKGYSLLYLETLTGEERFRQAADRLLAAVLEVLPRTPDGLLRYKAHSDQLLVDTLGMICPFLARVAAQHGRQDALDLCTKQLKHFVLSNVDTESFLPYHGYYAKGPYRLGQQGWGRGCGWYMLGLIGALAEMPTHHPDYELLLRAYRDVAEAVRGRQRDDGQWGWAIPIREARPDSSATSFIGYSLIRGIRLGLLDDSFQSVVDSAIWGLMKATRANGVIDGSLADCWGLALYPPAFGPKPYTQGMATALAAIHCSTEVER